MRSGSPRRSGEKFAAIDPRTGPLNLDGAGLYRQREASRKSAARFGERRYADFVQPHGNFPVGSGSQES
jgi:hypothetical protein